MADSSEEKKHDASDRKLEKAREEGQVAKSQEATMTGALFGSALVLMVGAEAFAHRLESLIRTALLPWGRQLAEVELQRRMMLMAVDFAMVVVPVLAAALIGALVIGFAQAGFVIAMKAVSPNFERVNPGAGLIKLISKNSLIKLGMTVVKAIAIGVVMWKLIEHLLPLGVGSAYFDVHTIARLSWKTIAWLVGLALLLGIVMAPLEYAIERWLFLEDQKMGDSEAKRDRKEANGDPIIQGARRRLQREMAREDPRKAVPQATAVVMNPTHFAVALFYSRDQRQLPTIVAKGVDNEALAIRRLAEESGVPVFVNPPLARALHQLPLNASIPKALLEPVAAVMRWVEGVGAQRAGA
jgi:type III secretion protein U